MNEDIKQRWINYFINIFAIVLLTLITTIFYNFANIMGQPIKNLNYGIILTNNIEEKNLTLPFPNISSLDIQFKENGGKMTIFESHFHKDFFEFKEVLNKNYIYSDDYDCKYWAYVWTLYYKENRLRYNWKLDYIDTQNHVFVMVSNVSGYIILDGDDQIIMMN